MGKIADSKLNTESCKMNVKHLAVPENKDSTENTWGCVPKTQDPGRDLHQRKKAQFKVSMRIITATKYPPSWEI